MTEDKTLITRRRALKGTSIAAGIAITGSASLWYSAEPAVASHVGEWNADNTPLVESDDGTVTAVNTSPAIDIDWQNFADGADSADVTITAHLRATPNDHIDTDKSDVVYDASSITSSTSGSKGVTGVVTGDTADDAPLDGTNTNGGVTINLDTIDITDAFNADSSNESEDITEADFEDTSSNDGNTITTVELELTTTVNGAQSSNPSATVTATFDVEVQNKDEEQSTGGTANTGASE